MTTKYIERHAAISGKKISQVREELEIVHDLIQTSRTANGQLYEILSHFRSPIGGPPQPDNPLIGSRGGPKLTPEQIESVFEHYLKNARLYDDDNGFRFRCPFHVAIGRAKRSYISVKKERGGPWQCLWKECRHNGRRRPRPDFQDGIWNIEQVAYDGGGNVLDFIVAITNLKEKRIIDRKQAASILATILAPKPQTKSVSRSKVQE